MSTRRKSVVNVRSTSAKSSDGAERAFAQGRLDVAALAKNRGLTIEEARRAFKNIGRIGRRKSRAAGAG